MSTEMLDRLQESKLRGLEELLDSWKTAVGMGGGKEEAAAIADFIKIEMAAIADVIVDEGIGVRQGLLRLWDYHWTKALAGEISDRREDGAKLRSLMERGGRALSRCAAAARICASGLDVARLSQFEEQAKAFPLWAEECLARWEMLDRPRTPLNRERLARSQEAYKRGECEDVANVIARLEQGGSFGKE